MITVTRKYRFAASHRLHVPDLPEAENQRLFGKCNNPFGHGHNYELDLSVRGPVDERSGRAVDVGRLDAFVQGEVVSRLHHRHMNTELPEFKALVPTTENLGLEIFRYCREHWPVGLPRLYKVRIAETERNIFEVVDEHGQT